MTPIDDILSDPENRQIIATVMAYGVEPYFMQEPDRAKGDKAFMLSGLMIAYADCRLDCLSNYDAGLNMVDAPLVDWAPDDPRAFRYHEGHALFVAFRADDGFWRIKGTPLRVALARAYQNGTVAIRVENDKYPDHAAAVAHFNLVPVEGEE